MLTILISCGLHTIASKFAFEASFACNCTNFFTSLLKQEGYTLDLFDCTFYQDINFNNLGVTADEERVKNRSHAKYVYELLKDGCKILNI